MLTLTAKLMDLDDHGQWLARALHNEKYQSIQGATVRLDKFSEIPLRSTLSYERRFRLFDSLGRPRIGPLSADEEKQLEQALRFYGEYAEAGGYGSYSFSPIAEMYEQGNRCAHCYYATRWNMSRVAIEELGLPHGLNLSAPNDASQERRIIQINNMGRFAEWWIAFGGFEAVTVQPSWQTKQALNALFGKRASVPVDRSVLDERYFESN